MISHVENLVESLVQKGCFSSECKPLANGLSQDVSCGKLKAASQNPIEPKQLETIYSRRYQHLLEINSSFSGVKELLDYLVTAKDKLLLVSYELDDKTLILFLRSDWSEIVGIVKLDK
ncbi:hypothetical protein [Halioxenophilus aromaticivorans]|uniref:Uncharacterized protein n=1 Tax=Halioxenophilus aromaticivorans TaxID=1306992 RepID=A0AAV3U2W7_9ALTE